MRVKNNHTTSSLILYTPFSLWWISYHLISLRNLLQDALLLLPSTR